MRTVIFWILFSIGSMLLVFSVLFSQTPGDERTFDKVIFSAAGVLLLASLAIGLLNRGVGHRRIGAIPTVILSAELAVCAYGLLSVLTYRRH
jgi:hypothetical protein